MAATPWKAWYQSARWKDLRGRVLRRDGWTCAAPGCGRLGASGMVVDHRTPHRGDERLFWDEANLQVLCASPCHAKVKQREEQGSLAMRGVWD